MWSLQVEGFSKQLTASWAAAPTAFAELASRSGGRLERLVGRLIGKKLFFNCLGSNTGCILCSIAWQLGQTGIKSFIGSIAYLSSISSHMAKKWLLQYHFYPALTGDCHTTATAVPRSLPRIQPTKEGVSHHIYWNVEWKPLSYSSQHLSDFPHIFSVCPASFIGNM